MEMDGANEARTTEKSSHGMHYRTGKACLTVSGFVERTSPLLISSTSWSVAPVTAR